MSRGLGYVYTRQRPRGESNFFNTLGVLIGKNDWDCWTLQSATLIGDRKGLKGPSELVHNYLTTAWRQDDSKTVYVGLHHWGSLDQEGNKIQNGTHIKDLGYYEPTDERYEGIERLFKYDFDGDQIVDGKAWKEPKYCSSCGLRKGEMVNPVRTPVLGPSRPSYDELEPIGLESTDMNSSLDDELTRMMFPGATNASMTAVEALF